MTAAVLANSEESAAVVAASAAGLADTLEFLQRTLPPEQPSANYFVSEQDAGGRWKDHPVAAISEAARLALQIDAAGANAYYALAAFSSDGRAPSRVRRTQKHAVSLRALFLDVDCGKPGAYATQDEAVAELEKFLHATGLPPPLRVTSGKGLHLYLALTEPVSRDEWKDAAMKLSALCSALGFKTDPACTTDAARVLRPIGTHWRKKDKGGPLFVRLLEDARSTPFATIKAILDEACQRHNVAGGERAPAPVQNSAAVLNRDFDVRYIYPAASAQRIADNCEQIRQMRDSGGCISEPRWYASLGVLAHTENGDEVAHEWSSGDPRYSHAETESRLTRLRGECIGPTTCERFADLHPDGCASCVHKGKIKSPIRLGYAQSVASDATQTELKAPSEPASSAPVASPVQLAPGTIAALQPADCNAHVVSSAFGAPAAVAPLFDIESARAGRFIHVAPTPRDWLLKDCLPAGVVGAIVASGGIGKTQAVLQLGVAVAVGVPFCDTWETGPPGEVLLLLAEDDEPEIHRRLYRIVRCIRDAYPDCDIAALIEQNLFIKSVVAENNLLTALTPHREVQQTDQVARIIATGHQLKNLKLIVLDPVSRFRGGDENKAEDMTRFIESLERIRAAFPGVTILVVHHTNKWSSQSEDQTQGAARGSSAFSDGVRFQMNLATLNAKEAARVPADERHKYLSATITKNNYAPPQPAVYLKRADGGVLLKADLAERAKRKEETTVLKIIRKIATSDELFSVRSFADTYCGESGIFGIGQNALVRCTNQAIGHGYLKKNSERRGVLCVTELGQAVLQAGSLVNSAMAA